MKGRKYAKKMKRYTLVDLKQKDHGVYFLVGNVHEKKRPFIVKFDFTDVPKMQKISLEEFNNLEGLEFPWLLGAKIKDIAYQPRALLFQLEFPDMSTEEYKVTKEGFEKIPRKEYHIEAMKARVGDIYL